MKTLTLMDLHEPIVDGKDTKRQTYSDLMITILTQALIIEGPKGQGNMLEPITSERVLKYWPIVESLKKIEVPELGTIDFFMEEEAYKLFKERLNKWSWPSVTKKIFDFIEMVNNAPDYDPNAKFDTPDDSGKENDHVDEIETNQKDEKSNCNT